MPDDDDEITPPQGWGAQELLRDKSREIPVPTETMAECPPCAGSGRLESGEETSAGYRFTYSTCDLCHGSGFVSPIVAALWQLQHQQTKPPRE